MKRIYEIEWEDENGPLWLCRDNLCLVLSGSVTLGKNIHLGVRDVTDDDYGGKEWVFINGVGPVQKLKASEIILKLVGEKHVS